MFTVCLALGRVLLFYYLLQWTGRQLNLIDLESFSFLEDLITDLHIANSEDPQEMRPLLLQLLYLRLNLLEGVSVSGFEELNDPGVHWVFEGQGCEQVVKQHLCGLSRLHVQLVEYDSGPHRDGHELLHVVDDYCEQLLRL